MTLPSSFPGADDPIPERPPQGADYSENWSDAKVRGYWRGSYLPVYRRYFATGIDILLAMVLAVPFPGEIEWWYLAFTWAVVNIGGGYLMGGRTPGKVVTGIATGKPMRVNDRRGIVLLVKPSPRDLVLRYAGHFIDVWLIGLLAVKWSRYRQTFGDMFASTIVYVNAPEMQEWVFDSVEDAERQGNRPLVSDL